MFYFEKKDMASEYNKALVKNVRVNDGTKDVVMQPGYFAVISGITDDDLYTTAFTRALGVPTSYLNYNGYDATMPTAPLVDKVVVCDPATVATATGGNGLVYRIGNETYGNALEAGVLGKARTMVLDDLFELGDENFAAVPGANKYAVLTAGSFLLTPAAAIPATGFTVEIVKQVYETTGAVLATDPCYIVRVVQL